MKIISKQKDYYDYLVGIYGEDERLVYDRRGAINLKRLLEGKESGYCCPVPSAKDQGDCPWQNCFLLVGDRLWTFGCGTKRDSIPPYEVFWRAPETPEEYINSMGKHRWIYTELGRDTGAHKGDRIDREKFFGQESFKYTEIGDDVRKAPIVFIVHYYGYCKQFICLNPILEGTPIASWIPAEEIFLTIQEFLGTLKDAPVKDSRTDVEKLLSAGFDKTTSFRGTDQKVGSKKRKKK